MTSSWSFILQPGSVLAVPNVIAFGVPCCCNELRDRSGADFSVDSGYKQFLTPLVPVAVFVYIVQAYTKFTDYRHGEKCRKMG